MRGVAALSRHLETDGVEPAAAPRAECACGRSRSPRRAEARRRRGAPPADSPARVRRPAGLPRSRRGPPQPGRGSRSTTSLPWPCVSPRLVPKRRRISSPNSFARAASAAGDVPGPVRRDVEQQLRAPPDRAVVDLQQLVQRSAGSSRPSCSRTSWAAGSRRPPRSAARRRRPDRRPSPSPPPSRPRGAAARSSTGTARSRPRSPPSGSRRTAPGRSAACGAWARTTSPTGTTMLPSNQISTRSP